MWADETWAGVLASVIDQAHLVTGEQLSGMVDRVVQSVGLRADVLVVNLAQRALTGLGVDSCGRIEVEGTLAGRAYQVGEVVASIDHTGRRLLWIPILDGTERVGVLRIVLDDHLVDDALLRRRCWSLAGLVGHVVMAKLSYSDRLRQLRRDGPLAEASELLWQLVPPRTFATDEVVVTALLEPYDRVAGDAYDYAADGHCVHLAVYDGTGHDLAACLATTMALTAVRNGRRAGQSDLAALAAQADDLLAGRPGPRTFVTAVLARLDSRTGALDYLVAGHPPPLLVRDGHMIKELGAPVQRPLGVRSSPARLTSGREQLEPGDRLLFYSDGIVEARDARGEFFGVRRLVDFTERAESARVSAPETLRRLTAAVLAHQNGELQDDATLLMVDWSASAHERLLPQRFEPTA